MCLVHDRAHPGRREQTLAILLPGALQRPGDLVQAGMVDAVRRRSLPLDLTLPDLQLNYVGETMDGSILQRLHEEVVLPARLDGYREIWLAGISIGGFIALAYAADYPGHVNGLCLLAPYPGSRILTNEIKKAGGLDQWNADGVEGDGERRVWGWMQSLRERPAAAPHIHFGYALQDRFTSGQQLMAEALPGAHVDTVAGSHDWPAWQRLWVNFLDRLASRMNALTTDNA